MNDDIVTRLEAHMGKADIADVLRDCQEAAAEILRLHERAGRAVEVKALVWTQTSGHEWRAVTVFGDAVIMLGDDGYYVWRIAPYAIRFASGSESSLERAQAATQAFCDGRIRSALAAAPSPPSVEPVAPFDPVAFMQDDSGLPCRFDPPVEKGEVAVAVAAEREACAKAAYAYAATKKTKVWRYAAQDIAAAIRSRGEAG